MDNIFVERLWHSLKYEAVYLHELTDGFHARQPQDMMDKVRDLPTSPQAPQPQQEMINRILAA